MKGSEFGSELKLQNPDPETKSISYNFVWGFILANENIEVNRRWTHLFKDNLWRKLLRWHLGQGKLKRVVSRKLCAACISLHHIALKKIGKQICFVCPVPNLADYMATIWRWKENQRSACGNLLLLSLLTYKRHSAPSRSHCWIFQKEGEYYRVFLMPNNLLF